MKRRAVFYSWQLDTDDRFNRSFIDDCLKQALEEYGSENPADTVIHRDTRNSDSALSFDRAICEKLARSSVVIADLSIINPQKVRRPGEWPACNPAVSFEIGCARSVLGEDAVIGVINTGYGEVNDLPVQLRAKRMLKYSLTTNGEKPEAKKQLVHDLTESLTECFGDMETEQRKGVARVHAVLAKIWLLGTELDEWSGIADLPNVVQQVYAQAKQLPGLMRKTFDSEEMFGRAAYIKYSMERAAATPVSGEFVSAIREYISAASTFVMLINDSHRFAVEPGYKAELLNKIAAAPPVMDWHIEQLRDGQFHRRALEELSYELRTIAFIQPLAEEPGFNDELQRISLDFRKHFLTWVKRKPKRDAAVEAIQDVRDQLSRLVDTFVAQEQMSAVVA